MRDWGVVIEGHAFDLEEWAAQLQPPYDPWIDLVDLPSQTIAGKTYVLRGSAFENCTDAASVLEVAKPLVRRLNGVVQAYQGGEQVALGPVVVRNPDGSYGRHIFVEINEGIRIRSKFSASPGSTAAPAVASPIQAALSAPPPEALDALEHFSRADNWHDLWKAYEALSNVAVAKHGRGTGKQAFIVMGVTGADVDNFALTAQMHRHHDYHKRPKDELTLGQGRAFVARLIRLLMP